MHTRKNTSLALGKWRPTQALVMEIRVNVLVLKPSTHRNLTAKPVVADVKELQIQCGEPLGKATVQLVVVQIQVNQALRELQIAHVKCQLVPRQVHRLGGLVGPEKPGCVAHKLGPRQVQPG